MLNFCNTIFHTYFFDYTALILLLKFFQQISHNFRNQEQTNFDLLLEIFIPCFFSQNGKTEYNYFNVISIIATTLFLIAQPNITYPFPPKSQQVIETN